MKQKIKLDKCPDTILISNNANHLIPASPRHMSLCSVPSKTETKTSLKKQLLLLPKCQANVIFSKKMFSTITVLL